MISIGPINAVSTESRHMSGVSSRKSPFGLGGLIVMLRMSGEGQAENKACRPASVEESATTGVTSARYFSAISMAALFSRSSRRAVMNNLTPASARRSAVARPSPALPPAIIAVLPLIFRSMLCSFQVIVFSNCLARLPPAIRMRTPWPS